MRVLRKFSRVQDSGTPANTTLGLDSAPTGRPTLQSDNQMQGRPENIAGFPVQRVVVSYHYTGLGTAQPLHAQLYVWEDETSTWYKCGDEQMLVPESIAWFDQPTLSAMGAMRAIDGTEYRAGNLELAIVVTAPTTTTADPDGTYTFGIGWDVSNSYDNVPARMASALAQVTMDGAHVKALSPVRTAGKAVLVQSDYANNAAGCWVGPVATVAANNGYMLKPGDSVSIQCADASQLGVFSITNLDKAQGLVE